MPISNYETMTAGFGPGDAVVIFTDGLVERRSECIDVGLERLRRLVEDSPRRSPQEMVEYLISTIDEPEDDIAVISLQRTA
jgi:phosphoserine phosphatase RsbU/P